MVVNAWLFLQWNKRLRIAGTTKTTEEWSSTPDWFILQVTHNHWKQVYNILYNDIRWEWQVTLGWQAFRFSVVNLIDQNNFPTEFFPFGLNVLQTTSILTEDTMTCLHVLLQPVKHAKHDETTNICSSVKTLQQNRPLSSYTQSCFCSLCRRTLKQAFDPKVHHLQWIVYNIKGLWNITKVLRHSEMLVLKNFFMIFQFQMHFLHN